MIRIQIEVRYERLAQGIRGAFLIRSADGDPHQVQLTGARLVPSGPRPEPHPLQVSDLLVDVQPGRDVIVPFEIRLGEVPRGIYEVQADVTIDGAPAQDVVQAEVRVR